MVISIVNFFKFFPIPVALQILVLLVLLATPFIPVVIWRLVEARLNPARLGYLQKLIRLSAGQDELLVRELQKQREGLEKTAPRQEQPPNFGVDK